MSDAIRYRRDIDGLRTIAVVPVVLFHAGVSTLGGGYVGVDVFFVISGFLITGIIAREVDEGRFSILDFYERRVRRILPALFALILFVLAGAAWLYLPEDFYGVARSVIATLLFVSNVNFWLESDYFGASSHIKPMLHTWSLAVEEQFYIVFPLLLALIAKAAPRMRKPVLWLVFVGSLAISIWQTRVASDAAFYLPFARAWELAAGALLAVGAVPAIQPRWAREAASLAGVAAIGYAVLFFTSRTPFPGAAALLPVLGAAALLHCAPGTIVGRVLATAPMVGIGLISYSLYLWHWPLIVFTEYATDRRLAGLTAAAVVIAAFVLACLSWRLVERPFRYRDRVPRPILFTQAAAGAAVLALLSGGVLLGHGWASRFGPDILRIAAGKDDISPKRVACHVNGPSEIGRAPCVLGAAVPPDMILWGDSHGVEIAYALGEEARRRGRALVQATGSSCTPVIGVRITKLCDRFNPAVMERIAADPRLKTVVLAGFWADTANARRRDLPAGLEATVARLRALGREVVIIGAVPPQTSDVPRRLVHLAQQGRLDQQAGRSRAQAEALFAYLRPAIDRLRAQGVPFIDPADALCRGPRCDIYRDGHPLYFDRHHLSLSGARIVAALAAQMLFDGVRR